MGANLFAFLARQGFGFPEEADRMLMGALPEGLKRTDIPAEPSQIPRNPSEEDQVVDEDMKPHYRRVVGKSLYLDKSRQDMSNAA